MVNLDNLFNIQIIDKVEQIPDVVDNIDFNRDIVFSFPDNYSGLLGFDYSGVIQFGIGEDTNLSVIRSKQMIKSPIWAHKMKTNIKFCCPCGIAPIFLKPSSSKSILSITPTYKNFIDTKLSVEKRGKRKQDSTTTVIYQNIEIESTFNQDLLISEFPQMILSKTTRLFDLVLMQTIFSDTLSVGKIVVVYNNEFYYKFKESI